MEGGEAISLYSTDWASPEEASSALLRLCGSVPPCQVGRSDPAPLRAYSDLQALRAWSGANASSGGLGSRISDQEEGSDAADDKSSQSEDPNDFFVQQSRRELQWRREQRCRTAQVPCAPSLAFHITLEELLSVTSSFCRDAALLAYASDMTHNVNSSPPHDAAALDQPELADSPAGSQALARKHLKEAIDSAHAMGYKQFLCSVWNAERSDDSHIVYRSPWSGRYMSPITSMPDTLDEAIIQSWEHEAQRIDAAAAQMRWAVACAAEERSLEAALERHLNRLLPRYMTAYTPAAPSSLTECHCPMTTVPHTTATAFVRRVTVPSRQPAATPLPSVEVIVLTRRSAHNCVCNGGESGVEPPLLVTGHAFEVRLSSEAVVVASHESSCVMSGHDARIKRGAPPSCFWYHCKKYKQDTAAVAGPSSSPQSCHAAVFGETMTSSCWVNADELAADLMQRVERAEGIAHREMNSRSRVALTALLHRS